MEVAGIKPFRQKEYVNDEMNLAQIIKNRFPNVVKFVDKSTPKEASTEIGTDGNTYLHLHQAAEKGDKDTVERLIDSGVDVDTKGYWGNTPLHYAAKAGNKDVVKLLLDREADVNARGNLGQTPLHMAAREGCIEVVEFLLKKEGIEVNARNNLDRTPLHMAAQEGCVEVVEFLLKKEGIEVNAKDYWSNTPLHFATWVGNEDIVNLLLNGEAKIIEDNYGYTPLVIAKRDKKEGLIKLLKVDNKTRKEIMGYINFKNKNEKDKEEMRNNIKIKEEYTNSYEIIGLLGNSWTFCPKKFFESTFYTRHQDTVLVLRTPEEKEGVRISQNKEGVRHYQIINGSYDIEFNWQVDDKKCSITMQVSSYGTVKFIEANVVDSDNVVKIEPGDIKDYVHLLKENKSVRISTGLNGEEMKLRELILRPEEPKADKQVTCNPNTNLYDSEIERLVRAQPVGACG